MAQVSRKLRKIRRLKRERSLAFRMCESALAQRDYARGLVQEFVRADEARKTAQTSQAIVDGVQIVGDNEDAIG